MHSSLCLIYPESAESGTLETLPETDGLELVKEDFFLNNYKDILGSSKLCITSEATLDSILKCLDDESKIKAIQSLKDKLLFRELLNDIYPEINYRHIDFDSIQHLKISNKKVIKPIKGCFGTAVKLIDENSNLKIIAQEIKAEINKNATVLSESVLSQSEFIVEDYIEGEEYAVDMFFDSNGKPHIVNIYYHPIPKHKAYLHMIYYTNKSIFEKLYSSAITFFNKLNDKLQLNNIALHSEFKMSQSLIPIEINAMRFGGMGLGNMIFHSLKVNPYKYFIEEKSPDWEAIWKHYPKNNFVYFVAYNGTQIDKQKQQPDLKKLESKYSKILSKTIFDYQKQLAFGTYTLEESYDNINKLLTIDFNEYFEAI